MVDARRSLAEAELLQYEDNKWVQYAGNAVAALCGVIGLMLILMLSSPEKQINGITLGYVPAPAELQSPLDQTDLASAPADVVRSGVITRSVSALDVMEVLGADRSYADAALSSLEKQGYISKKNLKSGLSVSVHLAADESTENGRVVNAVTIRPELGRSLIAKRQPDGSFLSAQLTSRLNLGHRRIAGTVNSSLSADLQLAGAEKRQVSKFLSVFAYNPKVPRALSQGDRFEMIYEAWEDERGQLIEKGDLVYASLDSKAERRSFYRYTPNDNGQTDFFDDDGDSAERFLTRNPVKGARISSRFGHRKHPISGEYQLHKGIDLKAPMSSRIYAAGDGVVEKMGYFGGYGRKVVIRHQNGYKTAYAHMSGYSNGMYVGAKVKQGDLIGFVGSTGDSTGPHLHFEVIRDGLHIDPMALQLPTGRKLAAKPPILKQFVDHRRHIDSIRRDLGDGLEMASVTNARQSEAP